MGSEMCIRDSYRIALDMVDQFYADAVINGLSLDRHSEENTVELFAQNLIKAGEAFLDNPQEVPFIPCWNRVTSAVPDILDMIKDAVEKDNA